MRLILFNRIYERCECGGMVDSNALGAFVERRVGSNPITRTKLLNK